MKTYLHIILLIFLCVSLWAEEKQFIVVDQNGSGDYQTISEAVNALPMFVYERIFIYIKDGVYEERIRIEQDNITLIGESRENTIIQFNMPRSDWEENKDHIGPGVVNIDGDDFILENLTVKNTQPEIGPHAFAVYGTGTRTIITNCNLLSKGADTVALWDYKTGMYYHSNCYFEGAVDFVCPRGWCYIKDSQFYELKESAAVWHAGGHDKSQKLVIVNSSFDGVKGFKLGRHHYESQFYFIDCEFSGNMADEPIYRVTYEDTTRNRPFNWGERYYFYNASGEGSKYEWLSGNLNSSDEVGDAAEISPTWTFNNEWDPEKLIPTKLPDSVIIPKDTSYTSNSALKKIRKDYPNAELVTVDENSDRIVEKEFVYAKVGQRELKLNIFSPSVNNDKKLPLVILIHGGGWTSGDRSMLIPLAEQLAENGFKSAVIEYRLSPEAKYPAAVEDIITSIQWLKVNCDKYAIDSSRVALLGTSAGGHLAALVGTNWKDKNYSVEDSLKEISAKVQAVIDIDGVLDLTHPAESGKDTNSANPSVLKRWLGYTYKENPNLWRDASPVNLITKQTPPILFINSSVPRFHAGRDEAIRRLNSYGVNSEVHVIKNSPHSFWLFRPWFEETKDLVVNYLKRIFE